MSEVKEDRVLPVLVNQAAVKLNGLAVRTSNRAEQDVAKQKIAPLWQQFMGREEVQSNTASPVYGCYYDYESDHNGEFSVLTGLVSTELASTALAGSELAGSESEGVDFVGLTLAAGEYLRFSATGEMPAVIFSLWGQIWHYFADTNCQFERSYITDYECYTSMDGVDIFIGVKQK